MTGRKQILIALIATLTRKPFFTEADVVTFIKLQRELTAC